MPERFATVQDFLAAQPIERAAEVEVLRELVKTAEPRLDEIVKWNSPSYVLDGEDRLTINAAGKGPARLILHLGAAVAEDKKAKPDFSGDPDGLLTWHSNIRASLALSGREQQRAAVVSVIREWLAR